MDADSEKSDEGGVDEGGEEGAEDLADVHDAFAEEDEEGDDGDDDVVVCDAVFRSVKSFFTGWLVYGKVERWTYN